MLQKLNVLFLCTGNSCRSQMAEGWARHLHGDRIEAYSAGVEARGLNPLAVRVMAAAGVDISRQTSKSVDKLTSIPFDLVVTVCDHARESCPIPPNAKKTIHAGFDDPPALAQLTQSEDEVLGIYRRVRDEIREFVRRLPDVSGGHTDEE
jgi:arsenate reductase